MLNVLREQFKEVYRTISSSIWFYPAIISVIYLAFAILLISVSSFHFLHTLMEYLPWLHFQSIDTPRAILTTLITGLISLMVLSFSMVMVVLAQATTNYSPKILIGLVSEKSHQFVLGHYLGTIIYSLVLLLGFHESKSHELATLGVLIGIILGIWCLVLFIYFIYKISQSIQINDIIERIYLETHKQLRAKIKDQKNLPELDETLLNAEGQRLKSVRSGYVQNWNKSGLERIASQKKFVIRLEFQPGDYIVKGLPVISILNAQEEVEEKVKDAIMDELYFYDGERISENYYYGFTQLMEIAIKALSPALNNPGIARLCVHNLTDLFRLKMETSNEGHSCDDEENTLLIWKSFPFESLLYKSFAPIRDYGIRDVSVCLSLIKTYHTLAVLDIDQKYKSLLQEHADSVIKVIKKMDLHTLDKEFIDPRIKESNSYLKLSLDE